MRYTQIPFKLLIYITIAFFCSQAASAKPVLATLEIEGKASRHSFRIETATSPEQWERGLMYRKTLPEDYGMLFVFPDEDIAQFWMKNTLIPLDMLFIDRSGKIIRIEENAEPNSLKIISSGRPVKAVLETSGGSTKKLGIKAGDRVIYETFKNP